MPCFDAAVDECKQKDTMAHHYHSHTDTPPSPLRFSTSSHSLHTQRAINSHISMAYKTVEEKKEEEIAVS